MTNRKNHISDKDAFSAFSAESAESAEYNAKNAENAETASNATDKTLLDTPKIPPMIYEILPSLLKDIFDTIDGDRSRDVLLTGALGVLSSCLENVRGKYGLHWYYPNLFIMIIGPAGKGKSSLKFADLLLKHHQEITNQEYTDELKEYERLLSEHEQSSSKSQSTKPRKPTKPSLKIPGNSSGSKVYQLLENNSGMGVIIETEADALGETFDRDWGSFSYLVRCAFGNESISLSRITNDVSIDIKTPKLSVVLSGTPVQLFKIVPNAENGLASRFIYYGFSVPRKWKSQRPTDNSYKLDKVIETKSRLVHELILHFKNREMEFNFNNDQWDDVDVMFEIIMSNLEHKFDESADSIIFRLGLIMFKICMTLTAIRAFESKLNQTKWDCHPDDFTIGKKLILTYAQHSLLVFKNLPKSSTREVSPLPEYVYKFLNALDNVFTTAQAIKVGQKLGIKPRTAADHLRKAKDTGLIERKEHGCYSKTDQVMENELKN